MGWFDRFRKRPGLADAPMPKSVVFPKPASRPPAPVPDDPRRYAEIIVHRRTPEEVAAAKRQGAEDSIYLHSSRWDELLVLDDEGLPPLRFMELRGKLWFREDSTGKLVKIANRKLPRLGIWSVKVRGTSYYPDAVRKTRIRIFEPVTLVREPDNEFDKNAIAVHSSAGRIGYYNKQMAASLAKRLDAGEEFEAYITSNDLPVNVIAASPMTMAHLRR